MDYKIKEVYDGRLPEYQVIFEDKVIKTFDNVEDAEDWVEAKKCCKGQTPCGEDDPCQ